MKDWFNFPSEAIGEGNIAYTPTRVLIMDRGMIRILRGTSVIEYILSSYPSVPVAVGALEE